jgi:hypothetical protein
MPDTLGNCISWLTVAATALGEFDFELSSSLCGRANLCNRALRGLQRRLAAAGCRASEGTGDEEELDASIRPADRARIALERVAAELAALEACGAFNAATWSTLAGLAAIVAGMRKDLAAACRGRFTLSNERN